MGTRRKDGLVAGRASVGQAEFEEPVPATSLKDRFQDSFIHTLYPVRSTKTVGQVHPIY